MEDKLIKYAEYFSALADENRIKIVRMLVDNEMCAGDILKELSISQPTLSHHMKLLVNAGIVNARKDGRLVFYTINDTVRDIILDAYIEITAGTTEKADEMKRRIKKKDNIVLL